MIFHPCPDWPWGSSSHYTMGSGSFPVVKSPGRGVYHPPHLAERLKKELDVQVTVHLDKFL